MNEFIKIIMIFLLFFIVDHFFTKAIRKKYGIKKPNKEEIFVNDFHKYGFYILIFIIIFSGNFFKEISFYIYFSTLFISLQLFQLFMELKFRKDRREHIVILYSSIWILTFILSLKMLVN